MRVLRVASTICLTVAAAVCLSGATGQEFPNKPIRIVTTGVGGSNDIPARLIAQALTASMGQPIVVENRPSGNIPGLIVHQASPDGYTLLVAGGSFTIGPLLQKTPYDPVRDFSPITLVSRQPSVLVLNPAVPAKSVQELIALAKAKPGALNYGASGIGAANHLAAELFNSMANVQITRVNYKGPGPILTDLIAGQLQLSFASVSSLEALTKSGKLRALAVSSAQPSALAPGLPTVAASGVPGYEAVQMTGAYAPAGTPDAIVRKLNQQIVGYLSMPDTRAKFLASGAEVVGSSPGELGAIMKSEISRMGKIIKESGLKAE